MTGEKAIRLLMTGNEAIAHGAIDAGVGYAGCFPGGPTTEVVYALADLARDEKPHVEWATNEKVALESASGAAMSGVRAMSVMKHFGVNNAADQLFSINLMGLPGIVMVVGDDPEGHSSHSEQDTRAYPVAAEIPCLEPSSPQDAYEMIPAAYRLSEEAELPIYFRVVKWLCHGSASVELNGEKQNIRSPQWDDRHFQTRPIVEKHLDLHRRLSSLSDKVENWAWNKVEGPEGHAEWGMVAAGYAYAYVRESLDVLGLADRVPVFKLTTINPLPAEGLKRFMSRVKNVLVVEEGEKLIEDRLKMMAFAEGLSIRVAGKEDGVLPEVGELKGEIVRNAIASLTGKAPVWRELPKALAELNASLPQRAAVPRPGNSHRPTVYAIRKFIQRSERKVVFMGDVGEAPSMARPLMKSHAAMGAGIGMAVGAAGVDPSVVALTIVGDGTLFGFALNGLASAVFNRNRVITVVCDNGTMESTGWQPTLTSGKNLTGSAPRLDIATTLQAIGMEVVISVNSRDSQAVLEALERAALAEGPSAVIAVGRYDDCVQYDEIQIDAQAGEELKRFVREFACPALGWDGEKAYIDEWLCTKCGDCAKAYPSAIRAHGKGVKA